MDTVDKIYWSLIFEYELVEFIARKKEINETLSAYGYEPKMGHDDYGYYIKPTTLEMAILVKLIINKA